MAATKIASVPVRAAAPDDDPGRHDVTNIVLTLGCVVMLWEQPWWGLTLLPIAAVSVALERWRPFKSQAILRTGWQTDVFHALITWSLAIFLGAAAVGGIVAAVVTVAPHAVASIRHLPLVWRFAIALVASDLGAYFEHRACHRYDVLWRFHSIHHMGENLDWLSRYRIHPLDALVLNAVELTPFLLLGVPAWLVAADAIFVFYQGTFSHSNIRVSFGPLWWVVKNPELHRWHHAKERRAANANFCERFPIWDVIFRTVYMPRDRRPAAYGIPGREPVAYVDQILEPLIRDKQVA